MRLTLLAPLALVPLAQDLAAQTFIGPLPYLSAGDIPVGFYAGAPSIEDFEDGLLSFGITGTGGNPFNPGAFTDSVDADDGVIDGSGTAGHSWFGSGAQTFTFPSPATAAGIVWTDGGPTQVQFEAFGPGMVSLGVFGPFPVGDAVFTGTTAEDRFFGVQHAGGIIAIRLNSNSTIELDHVQFGDAGGLPCGTVANSTGQSARISTSGSTSVAANDLVLACDRMPDDSWSFFLTSRDLGNLVHPGGSSGNLCLGGAIGRFVGPGQLQNSGTLGAVSLAIDNTLQPTPTGLVQVQAGETWHFTTWYRDTTPGGGTTNNFSDVVSLTFGA